MSADFVIYGLPMRDQFAARAMQALLAAPDLTDAPDSETAELVARCAYRMADAMLAAREIAP